MVINFSSSYGSYVSNQFPSIVMFGMKGVYVPASGTIQGHHGPLVLFILPLFHIHVKFLISFFSSLNAIF